MVGACLPVADYDGPCFVVFSLDFRNRISDPGGMKLFAQMLSCVFVGLSLGSAISWQRHRSKLLEVRVIKVVETRDQSSMRFSDHSIPHTIVEFRPPVKQWAIDGILGDVGDVIHEIAPSD